MIALWGESPAELAADLGAPYGVVKQWKRRGAIPPGWWMQVVKAAHARGHHHVTTELLSGFAQQVSTRLRVREEGTSCPSI